MKLFTPGRMPAAALALAMTPAFPSSEASACACGCSVYDVGAFGNLPQEDDHGGRVFFEWYHQTQSKNWIGGTSAPGDVNLDKRIETNWYVAGIQYMFNRDWGIMAKIPYADRKFITDTSGAGDIARFNATVWGDAEIQAMYTGFSKDLSTGLTFGVKVPTGDFKVANFDRDTQIGTGSTDLLIGAFHRGMITGDNAWQYFTQVRWQIPVAYQNSDDGSTYRPGSQVDAAVGLVYNNGYKWLGFDKVAPVLQLIGSHRERDRGTGADPANTGFDRLFISPGAEATIVLDEQNKRTLKVYGDVEIPLYTRTNACSVSDSSCDTHGQLVAPVLYKLTASYNF